ncbi:hypothetical protein B0A48_18361 [Cryoendolithus antarcticus]|uniref:GED domain-containing protein n=1 Tax=Cryoendolithus antarcticus TaxID=1507870 RepID=A0A1V8SAC7_9PEZI|nr:hypothetical protein B0A48_18361 [Cryoendolithus antarcticus]
MGLRDYGDNDEGPAFAEDVLRIRILGPSGLHLSIVDLPGLITFASEDQTEADVQTVHRMVDSYVEKPRTIILAVVQAGNDIANQSIIRKSKTFDRAGQRTVGIITKPDLINEGAEGNIATLAKNQGTTKLKLGFFLLKNPSPKERESASTPKMRSEEELRYFMSCPWKDQKLEPGRVGIDKLKTFLQNLLDQHIEKELPKVRDQIKAMIRSTEQDIVLLPPERPTTSYLRMFLSDLAMQYNHLTTAALNGDYQTSHATFFTTDGIRIGPTRLRALIHSLNTSFSDRMRDKGQKLKMGYPSDTEAWVNSIGPVYRAGRKKKVAKGLAEPWWGAWANLTEEDLPGTTPGEPLEDSGQPDVVEFIQSSSDVDQKFVTEAEMKTWVYMTTRGRELPGNYNPVLLTALFHQQSVPWQHVASEHVEIVHTSIVSFVQKAIAQLRLEEHVLAEIKESIEPRLQERKQRAEDALMQLCTDERQQPITYNHYYIDNVQKSRLDSTQKMIEQAMVKADPDQGGAIVTAEAILSAIRRNITVNMDEQACSEALDGLNAYYKVALKSFVDNVCKQVVERHLLRDLQDIFSPKTVAMYTDEELERIAGEKPDVMDTRKELREQLHNLKAGLEDLRK